MARHDRFHIVYLLLRCAQQCLQTASSGFDFRLAAIAGPCTQSLGMQYIGI